MAWLERVHIPFLMRQHQEKDHAKHSIRRYMNALLAFMLDWTIMERRKLMKICETAKLTSGEKYCLAFHPSQAFRDLQEMGGVRLKDLKEHTNAIGGAWGSDTWACLVRDDVDIDFDQSESQSGLENTKSKRSILIPVSIFTSAQIMKLCDYLGQNEDYRRFGADEETPSGVEDQGFRNSTQVAGSQGLSLQISSIETPEVVEEDDLEFDHLPEANDTFVSLLRENEEQLEPNNQEETDFDMEASGSRTNLSKQMSQSKTRSITEISKTNKTYFVCDCGYSSANKSATSRHKCRNGDSVLFKCLQCTKICRNPGSLKRHVDSKHKNTNSSNDTAMTSHNSTDLSENDNQTVQELPHSGEATTEISQNANNLCTICGKTLKTEANLLKHMEKVHKTKLNESGSLIQQKGLSDTRIRRMLNETDKENANQTEKYSCNQCGKVLKTEKNLERHLENVHKANLETQTQNSIPETASEATSSETVDVETLPEQAPPQPAGEQLQHGRVTRAQMIGRRRRSISLLRHKGRKK